MTKKKPTIPNHGYNFEEKQKYREKVWDIFAEKLEPKKAVVVFLPSKEGYEIPLALDRGFKEENLIAIDDCPAIIAVSKWRKKYPKIKFYGNSISRASQRIKQDGISVDAANLDLCGNISMPMINEFKGFMLSGCLSGEAVVSLTMLCGRESTATNTLAELYLKSINKWEGATFNKRIQVLLAMVDCYYIKHEHEGEYKSGKQKMSYGIFSVLNPNHLIKKAIEMQEVIEKKLKNYSLVKKEHHEIRWYYPAQQRVGETIYHRGIGGDCVYKMTKKLIDTIRDVNDIYWIWLSKEEEEIKIFADKALFKWALRYGWKASEDARRWLYSCGNTKRRLWKDLWNNFYYDGCKGYRSMSWCHNKKKAEKYLDSIDWHIAR